MFETVFSAQNLQINCSKVAQVTYEKEGAEVWKG
jgi:hypothetical protein